MTKEKIQDFTLRVTNANKTEMIAILYDIAVTYMQDAILSLEKDDFGAFSQEIGRAKNTIRELMNSTDTSEKLGLILLKLYVYANKELTKALINKKSEPILEVIHIFTELKEAYEYAATKDCSGPVMEHTETVYSGLTYNRYMKNESVTKGSSKRGFLA